MIDVEQPRRDDGLTEQEGQVMDALTEAWNNYLELEQQHPADLDDFEGAIHCAQDLLALRIVRRMYPAGWATWQEDDTSAPSDLVNPETIR